MSDPRSRGGPLEGFRVLDLSSVVMGPWATHVLADYGADVVKVESPEGDVMRRAPPARNPSMGAVFLHSNRSKRSIVLDLKRPEGRDALLRLSAGADVLVHNVRMNAMQRLGLDYDTVAAANRRIIYASLVGYAQNGPYAPRPAYDDLIQGASGLSSLFVESGDDAPRYVPALVADRVGGITAVNAILAALLHRERTGRGQAIEIPMFETMVEFVLGDHLGGLAFVPPAGPFGYQRLLTPHRRPYRTLDGFVCILLYNDAHWERFFALSGHGERYAADARLSDGTVRRENYDEAYRVVAEIVATRSSAEWLDVLQAADIPAMPLHRVDELLADPHLVATEFFREEDHPTEGRIRTLAVPTRWSASPPARTTPAPALGENTDEVLREANFSDAEIAALRSSGAVPRNRVHEL